MISKNARTDEALVNTRPSMPPRGSMALKLDHSGESAQARTSYRTVSLTETPIFSSSSLRNGVEAPLRGMMARPPPIFEKSSPMPIDEYVSGMRAVRTPRPDSAARVTGPTATTDVFVTAARSASCTPSASPASKSSETARELMNTVWSGSYSSAAFTNSAAMPPRATSSMVGSGRGSAPAARASSENSRASRADLVIATVLPFTSTAFRPARRRGLLLCWPAGARARPRRAPRCRLACRRRRGGARWCRSPRPPPASTDPCRPL